MREEGYYIIRPKNGEKPFIDEWRDGDWKIHGSTAFICFDCEIEENEIFELLDNLIYTNQTLTERLEFFTKNESERQFNEMIGNRFG